MGFGAAPTNSTQFKAEPKHIEFLNGRPDERTRISVRALRKEFGLDHTLATSIVRQWIEWHNSRWAFRPEQRHFDFLHGRWREKVAVLRELLKKEFTLTETQASTVLRHWIRREG